MTKSDEPVPLAGRLLGFAARPLSAYWLLLVVILAAGIIISIVDKAVVWEAIFSALVLAVLIVFMARRTNVPPWPWSK